MKNKTTLLLASMLPCSAWAGSEVYVQPATAPDYSQSPIYAWFAGASVGYLFDAEDEFYSVHLGRTLVSDGAWQHSIFLEVGYSELENDSTEIDLTDFGIGSGSSFTGEANLEAIIVPITLNYKLDRQITDRFGVYVGVGAGVAVVDVDGNFNDPISEIDESGNDSDVTFFAQAFAGLDYAITEQTEVFAGLRYMFIDDYSVTTTAGTLNVGDNDDVLAELGIRFHF